MLAEIDLDATSPSEIARSQGRQLGASPEEVEAAAVCVKAALAHPVLRRAAAAAARGALRREAPLVLRLADGTLAEGIVDLALREEGPDGPSWTVVDFKTDHDVEERRSHYEAQVRLYTRAISEATGEPARGVLLLV